MEIPHLCLNVIFDEVDDLSKVLLECLLADGRWHLCLFLAAGYIADQPEHDTMCCEGSRLCDCAEVQQITLLTLGNQKILDGVERWGSNAKKSAGKEAPLVDAMDVQMLMLAMPFVLDGLAHQELSKFNAGKGHRDQVRDPFRPIIGAYNDYLHWYHQYRSRRLPEPQVESMRQNGLELIETLQTVFPHEVTYTRQNGSVYRRSVWCTEKVHSIKHCGENYREAGRCKNYSTQALETRHKSALKAVAHKTNNQASVGGSVLRANLQLEANQDLARHIDRKGIRTIHDSICANCAN